MILMTTVHDPSGRLLDLCEEQLNQLSHLFSESYFCISDATNPDVITFLSNRFKHTKIIPKKGAADARRNVLSYAAATKQTSSYYMYCDFDRIITWLDTNEKELTQLVQQINSEQMGDYIVLGRTEKAFMSHPKSWQETESVTNFVASKFFHLDDLDITAGGAILSKKAMDIIKEQSNHSHTDCEWPKLVVDSGGKLYHIKVNGLCFDTINTSNQGHHDDYLNRLRLSLNILGVFQ